MKKLAEAVLLTIMTAALVCAGAVSVSADMPIYKILDSGPCGDGLTWEYYGYKGLYGELRITGEGDMTLYPEGDYPWSRYRTDLERLIIYPGVTSIPDCAFRDGFFEGDLIVPEGVVSVGDNAFRACQRFDGVLSLPGSLVTIGDYAFAWCNHLSGGLTIPEKTAGIGEYAFISCSGLSGDLTVPGSVRSIGAHAFEYCSGFDGKLTISEGVVSIGERAFWQCTKLNGEAVFPGSVENIGDNAFSGCVGLTSALFEGNAPSSVGKTIFGSRGGAFAVYCYEDCAYSFTSDPNYSAENETWYGYRLVILKRKAPALFTGPCGSSLSWTLYGDGELEISGSGDMWDYGFEESAPWAEHCSDVKTLKLDDGVTKIGDYAFDGLMNYYGFKGSLTIPDTVTAIGERAFSFCDGFDSLSLGKGVESVGAYAFYECTGFTGSLVIPDSVSYIGNDAFLDCSSFSGAVTIPCGAALGDENPFAGMTGVTAFETAAGCTGYTAAEGMLLSADGRTLISCPAGKAGQVSIPDGVESIGNMAFGGCAGLTGILIVPDSAVSIGDYAFADCTGLTSVFFEGAVPAVGEYPPFIGCGETMTIRCLSENAAGFMSGENYDPAGGTWCGYKLEISEKPPVKTGDVDGDGKACTPLDAMRLARYLAGWSGYDVDFEASDLDGDGAVTVRDAVILARNIAGWPDYLILPYNK